MKLSHNSDFNLVKRVLSERTLGGAIFRSVRGEHFGDELPGRAWDFVLEHWASYGVVPDFDTIFENFPELRSELLRVNPKEPAEFYADSILEGYARKGVVEKITQVIPGVQSDVRATIDRLRQTLAEYDLIRDGVQVMNLANSARERSDFYNRPAVYGVPYGWDTLDKATMGAQPGELIGFAARAGQGKSWILLRHAHHVWKTTKKRVLVVATELSSLQMMARFDALHLRADYNIFKKQMLTTEEQSRYANFLFDLPREDAERFMITEGYGMTPSGLNVLIDQYKPDIVLIDGVYLLESDTPYRDGQDWQKIRYLANELKHRVARRNNIPVVFNTQFGRSVGTAIGKTKKVEGGVEDMAYGDEFGKAADLLVSISRTDEDLQDSRLSLKIIKGRETADNAKWSLSFDFSKLSFHELDPYATSAFTGASETEDPEVW